MALPVLTYFKGQKTGNDVQLFANYGVSLITKRLYNGGEVANPNCSGLSCDGGGFTATVLTTPLNGDAMGSLPAYAPMNSAAEGQLNPPAAGILANLVCLPDPNNDFLICYDQSFDPNFGSQLRAVARKYNPVDHLVPQRPDNTLRLSDMYVSNFDGLRSINGRLCTLIAKVFPRGGGAVQEIIYFGGAMLNVSPLNTSGDGNQSIENTAEGTFSFAAVFSATPT